MSVGVYCWVWHIDGCKRKKCHFLFRWNVIWDAWHWPWPPGSSLPASYSYNSAADTWLTTEDNRQSDSLYQLSRTHHRCIDMLTSAVYGVRRYQEGHQSWWSSILFNVDSDWQSTAFGNCLANFRQTQIIFTQFLQIVSWFALYFSALTSLFRLVSVSAATRCSLNERKKVAPIPLPTTMIPLCTQRSIIYPFCKQNRCLSIHSSSPVVVAKVAMVQMSENRFNWNVSAACGTWKKCVCV